MGQLRLVLTEYHEVSVGDTFFHKHLSNFQHYLKYAYTIPFHLRTSGFDYNKKNTIAVFAQPRGGSTWFTDLLITIPQSAKIDGPLYQGPFVPDGKLPDGKAGKLKSFNRLGFHYHQYIPEEAEVPEAAQFFERLFAHQFYTPYIFQETSLKQLSSSNRFVFKFYHASLMMPWLVKHFDMLPIFLVRNPYAVVASQLKYEAFGETIKTNKYQLPKFPYAEIFEPYESILSSISKPEEILTARWCLNYVPLISKQQNNLSWLTVSYESLLLNKDWEIKRLFDYLNESIPDKLAEVFRIPSFSTNKQTTDYQNVRAHLMRWKQVLSADQVSNIKRILDLFEVQGYSEKMEPDYSYIYNNRTPKRS